MKVGDSSLTPSSLHGLYYGEGWPRCPYSLFHSWYALSSAKKGSLEDKDDISKLVTGLVKTSICRQMSCKAVEGNEVRAALGSFTLLEGSAAWC